MDRRLKKMRRLGLLSLVLLSLFARVLVPSGYMPSAWSDGGPFVICPDGLFNFETVVAAGQGELAHHSGHHGGHAGHSNQAPGSAPTLPPGSDHDPANDHGSYSLQFCPIGSALGAAAAPQFEVVLAIAYVPNVSPDFEISVRFSTPYLSLYHARGPPRLPLLPA